LYESTSHITLISDRDTVIAVSGASKKEYMDKAIGEIVENCMEERRATLQNNAGEYEIIRDNEEEYSSYVIAPIIAGGDPIGSVIMLTKNDQAKMGDLEVKLVETAAGFLAKQMEQ
jgi:AbrB family transcriptional regulator (stage V sporulation protein T)